MSHRHFGFIAALVCATALLGLAPAAASATTTLSYSSTTGLSITGDAGNNSARVVVVFNGASDVYRVTSASPDLFGSTGCGFSGGLQVDCPITGLRAVTASFGDGGDGIGLDAEVQQTGTVFGPATVDLGSGDDGFASDSPADQATVDGGAGEDHIFGGGGADTLRGGVGPDQLSDGAGADTLIGGDDDDRLFADGGTSGESPPQSDSFDGGAGTDFIIYNTETAPVTISLDNVANDGRAGENDNALNMENVIGGRGGNTITGNSGPNRLSISTLFNTANLAPNVIHGGDGDDNVGGAAGPDQLFGEGGDDTVGGGSGNDTVDGGGGNDELTDGEGNDTVLGGPGNDEIDTSEGVDIQRGGDGNDDISFASPLTAPPSNSSFDFSEKAFGEAGNDTIRGGGAVKLTLDGGPGADDLRGGPAGDALDGGPGDDFIDGFGGDDVVHGGSGDDTLDNILFQFTGAGRDTIFGEEGDDTIDVKQIVASVATVDKVNCGTNSSPRIAENDSVSMNLIDFQGDCENVSASPAGVSPNAHVSSRVVKIPAHGPVPIDLSCRRRADHPRCTGTLRLGAISKRGKAHGFGSRAHYAIKRGESKTLSAAISAADRHRLRGGRDYRVLVEIVEPGNARGPSTTIQAITAESC